MGELDDATVLLEDLASELSEAERAWAEAKEGAERDGWRVYLLGPTTDANIYVSFNSDETNI